MLVTTSAEVGGDHALVHARQDVAGEQLDLVQRPPDGQLAPLKPERRHRAEQEDAEAVVQDQDPDTNRIPRRREVAAKLTVVGPGKRSQVPNNWSSLRTSSALANPVQDERQNQRDDDDDCHHRGRGPRRRYS